MVKTRINLLQKEIKDNLRIESQASWEKSCNHISSETNHTQTWRKIKNFLKPQGQRDYPALHLYAKTAKTKADKVQLFAETVERHFGIQSDNFDLKHFDEVNQFIQDNYKHLYPPEDLDDHRTVMDDDHNLVADIDSDTLIRMVKFLNPSFTKPFCIHTFYQGGGGGGGRANPPAISKTVCPHEREIWQDIRDTFESLRNAKIFYIVFT